MPRKKRASTKRAPVVFRDPAPVVTEGFASYTPGVQGLQTEPAYWNFLVLRRYRVTVELIDEPRDVLVERLRKLWRQDSNAHHSDTFKEAAEELGIVLDPKEYGIERKT
jgi:hypothetical protein